MSFPWASPAFLFRSLLVLLVSQHVLSYFVMYCHVGETIPWVLPTPLYFSLLLLVDLSLLRCPLFFFYPFASCHVLSWSVILECRFHGRHRPFSTCLSLFSSYPIASSHILSRSVVLKVVPWALPTFLYFYQPCLSRIQSRLFMFCHVRSFRSVVPIFATDLFFLFSSRSCLILSHLVVFLHVLCPPTFSAADSLFFL